MYERLELIFPASGFLLLPHSVNTKIKTNRYVKISSCFSLMVHFQAPKAATLCYCQMLSFLSGRVGREVACEQALWLRKGRRESAKKRIEERGLVTPQSLLHSPLGHFTLTKFLFGAFSRACSLAWREGVCTAYFRGATWSSDSRQFISR